MSYRTSPQRTPSNAASGHKPAGASRRPEPGQPKLPHDYTLGHAGRQVRIGPIAFWLSVSGLLVMALWSAGTATYFAFRDDVLTGLVARQAEMQYAYEDRITELRGQIDRLTSRQMLDQEQVEQRMGQLQRRQGTLESRANAIAGIASDPAATGSVRQARPALTRGDAGNAPTPKPSPINDTIILAPPSDRNASLESRVSRTAARASAKKPAGMDATLARLEESLDRVEHRQSAALAAIEEGYDKKVRRMRGVLTDLGIDVSKVAPQTLPRNVGGPFVGIVGQTDSAGFERHVARIQLASNNVERLNRTLLAVPVRKPLDSAMQTSSGFGVRVDPFVRAPAMHTGLDFRAPTGEIVRATAAGKIVTAGWSGGYGKLVEIDHGNGLSTRYGHLSQILVSEDQTIKPGQVIGRVGSTGRSTGPHLHYETRIDGDAVDPHKFLRAGLRLGEKS